MREAIKADRVANRIRLLRSQFSGAFLIVEGDKDKRIYGRFIMAEACRLEVAHSRENAISAALILERERFVGVLAIVDADFDVLESRIFSSSNIFITDTHDLETMMLKSPALEKLLMEIGSETKLDEFVKVRGKELREALLEECLNLGYLRLVSLRHGHALKFEGLKYRDFTDLTTLTINQSRLIKTVKNHSQKLKLSDRELQRQIETIRDEKHDKWHVCCGHDLIGILSIGLRKAIGSRDSKEVEPEIIERSLRLAYESAWFRDTKLYASIKAWEGINGSFRVIPVAPEEA